MQSIITIYLLGICCLRFVVAAWHSQECFPCVSWKESSVAQNSRISQTLRTVNSRDPLHGFHKIVPEWAACLMARNTSLCLWAGGFRSILPNSSERLYRGRLNRKPLSPGQHNQNRKQPQVPTVYFVKASQGNSMISVSMKNLFFCISYRLSKPPVHASHVYSSSSFQVLPAGLWPQCLRHTGWGDISNLFPVRLPWHLTIDRRCLTKQGLQMQPLRSERWVSSHFLNIFSFLSSIISPTTHIAWSLATVTVPRA